MKTLVSASLGLVMSAQVCAAGAAASNASMAWQPYSAEVFEQAEREDRLILLDLVAVWCHWCHVMEQKTYADPEVRELLERHYVAVQADHDARPDLAERYRDYGWPATIILTPDGRELVKRAGYIDPQQMRALLARTLNERGQSVVESQPAPTRPRAAGLSVALRQQLIQRHLSTYDEDLGGLRLMQKFLDADSVEYDLELASRGDQAAADRARQTLSAAAALIDPAFGGAYQYSTHGDWQHPHYEKIALTQANYLRVYSRAYQQLGDDLFAQVAMAVGDYVIEFWRSEQGGFFNSQDADLKQGEKAHDYFALPRQQRLALGQPRIDRNRYASSNGMLIEGLVRLHQATGERRYLAAAVKAFEWVMRERLRDDGGFAHGGSAEQGLFLSDNLYMARAMLALYEVSQQAIWLTRANTLAAYIDQHFADPRGGLVTAVADGSPLRPKPQIDLNIHAAKFFLRLAELSARREALGIAEGVMAYLSDEQIALARLTEPGLLSADRQWRQLNAAASSATEMSGVSNARL